MILEARLQALQDLDRLFLARFAHINFLEAPRQRPILLEDPAVFLIGGGAYAFQIARGEHRLNQVGCIHHAARGGARTDDGVDFVDEQHCAFLALELCEHVLQAFLEIAAVLGAGQQCAKVERIDGRVGDYFRHFAIDDHLGQAFSNGGLADAGFTDEQRIILASAAQDLNGALDFVLTTNQGIDLARCCLLVEVGGVGGQRIVRRLAVFGFFFGRLIDLFAVFFIVDLRYAVRDAVDHIEARDVLLVEQIDRMGFALAEDRDQHIGAIHFLFARGLDVEHRALQHALKPQCRLRIAIFVLWQQRRRFTDEFEQLSTQGVQIRATGAQHFGGGWIIQQCQQQMLDGHEFVALLTSLLEGHIERDFEFFA